jgi:hypothetical protein
MGGSVDDNSIVTLFFHPSVNRVLLTHIFNMGGFLL